MKLNSAIHAEWEAPITLAYKSYSCRGNKNVLFILKAEESIVA